MPTSAERRAVTRAAVVRAATDALVDGGMAGFTAPEVVRRGDFSNGTIFRYFPTMVDLAAGVVEHVFTDLSDDYAKRYANLTREHVTLDALVAMLWQIYDQPQVTAVYELYAAARTDRRLHEAIAPMIQAHVDVIEELGPAILADITDADPELTGRMVSLTVLAMQGLALYMPVASHRKDDAAELVRTLVQVGQTLLPPIGLPPTGPAGGRSERRPSSGGKKKRAGGA